MLTGGWHVCSGPPKISEDPPLVNMSRARFELLRAWISGRRSFRTLYVFVIIELGTRRILHHNVTAHPTAGLAAVPGGASGRPSVSVRDPRQGQHLLEAIGQGSDGPWRESSSNSRASTHGKLRMRTVRRDITSGVPGLPDSAQRTPPENDYQRMGTPLQPGRPHSSLGPGIPEPNQDGVPASDHRHKVPAGYRVVKTSVLGGLHHEYRLVKEAA